MDAPEVGSGCNIYISGIHSPLFHCVFASIFSTDLWTFAFTFSLTFW